MTDTANNTQSGDNSALENWDRYTYGRQRGHIDFMAIAEKCEGMYLGGGSQWSEEDKAILRSQGRPFYEFNEVMPSINSALGYQINNRMDIAFKPRGGKGDLMLATTISKVVMQVCDQAKLRWKETQVFGDGLIEQRGYYDIRMCFDTNIKGDIAITDLDPRDVIPDPDSKTYDPDGWADVIITRWYTLDEIEQLYGKKARESAEKSNDIGNDWGDQEEGAPRNKFGTAETAGGFDSYRGENGLNRYRVIDRQKFVYQMTDCLVYPETGDIEVVDQMTEVQVSAAMADGAVKARRMHRRVHWVVTTYSAVLFDDISPYPHYTVVPYFAYFRRGKTRGMVDNAIGPQDALNKAVSQFVHIINTSANSGWVVQQNSLTNMTTDDLKRQGASTGLVLEYKEGTTAPSKITANAVPTGVDRLIDRATKALKDVTVPDAMRGNEGNAVSGVAKQADQFASQQQLAVPLDNLAYTRHLLAKRVLSLVQRYYDSYRVFRITETDPATGKEVENNIEINKFDPETGEYTNDVTMGTYDVVITEQPMQVTFENSQFSQALEMRKSNVAIPDATVIRYSNLADKHEILDQMQRQGQPTDPTLEAKAQLMAAQARKTDAETTATAVESQYGAIQTAQVIAQTPATSGLADALLRSAGYTDRDMAPIIPQAPEGMPSIPIAPNTNPMTPANPAQADVGLNQGIETQRADGVRP